MLLKVLLALPSLKVTSFKISKIMSVVLSSSYGHTEKYQAAAMLLVCTWLKMALCS